MANFIELTLKSGNVPITMNIDYIIVYIEQGAGVTEITYGPKVSKEYVIESKKEIDNKIKNSVLS